MAVEIEIAPGSDAFPADDDRWLAQVAGLYDELRQEGVPIRSENRPAPPGEKGAELVAIITALGSAGAFSAMITVIQSWLSRERTRHLDIRIRDGDDSKRITIDADTDNATLERLAQQAMGQGAAP